jgi:hypothetical protein
MITVSSNSIERIFLGLKQPPLRTAAETIITRYQESSTGNPAVDLSNTLVVLPTLRSCRRMLQMLVDCANQKKIVFTPPQIITVGDLPEHLYAADKLPANDLAQQIAWSKALDQSPPETIEALTGIADEEKDQDEDELQDWQPMAQLMVRLHTRLASDIWSFRSVAREVKKLKNFLAQERKRWEALEEIQDRYYKILESVNLWDRQASRSYAAAGHRLKKKRCHTKKDILLVGVADLNRSLTGMLAQVADKVTCMVAADDSMADRFDEMGSLIATQWLDATIPIDDDNILIVDKPVDQAQAVIRHLHHLPSGEKVATDQVTIGVPDAKLIPPLQRALNSAGLPHRNLAGRALDETAPVKLMVACRDYLRLNNYDSFASLIRHPDVFAWIAQSVGSDQFLAQFDAHQNEHLPDKVPVSQSAPFGDPETIATIFDHKDPNSEKRAIKAAQQCQQLNDIHALIAPLLKPLSHGVRPLAQWGQLWTEVLLTVYGDRELNRDNDGDRQTIAACEAIRDALGNQQQVPEGFGIVTNAAQALQWALDAAAEKRILANPQPDAIELAGWLDLSLDDADVLVVTGMNNENVPTSEVGHQFLPNALCEQLGILDNNRRYARDCYALTVMTAVRKDYLLIAGRNDRNGEPNKPSRLLFADDAEVAAVRARAFFMYSDLKDSEHSEGSGDSHQSALWLGTESDAPDQQQFPIPYPHCDEIPTSLSVTKFKEYLKCPYRFYLNIIMKLRPATDDWRELSGGTFGDLAHNVLEAFAESALKDSKNAAAIFDFLSAELNTQADQIFLGSNLPAVKLQIEQLRARLERFADCQAEHRRSGWQIVSTEELLRHELEVDGEVFTVTGKIDRVDRHEETRQVAIWDYKTSDQGDGPNKAHLKGRGKKQKWQDLQLPLYRHLIKEVDVVKNDNLSTLKLGYVLLSRDLDNIKFEEADFAPEMLKEADELVADCIRKIRAGIFWPPTDPPPLFSDDLAGICQDNVAQPFDIAKNTPAEMAIQSKDTVVELPW